MNGWIVAWNGWKKIIVEIKVVAADIAKIKTDAIIVSFAITLAATT